MPPDDGYQGFTPVRKAPPGKLVLVWMLGPLLWLAAFVIVGVVVHRTDIVEVGLAVAAGSLLIAVAYLLVVRALRVRREREA